MSSRYENLIRNAGPVEYWPMDEQSGVARGRMDVMDITVGSAVTRGVSGLLRPIGRAQQVADAVNNGLTNSSVPAGFAPALGQSVEFWITTTNSGPTAVLFAYYVDVNNGIFSRILSGRIQASWVVGGTFYKAHSDAALMTTAATHYIAATVDAGGNAKVYYDGNSVETGTPGDLRGAGAGFRIGGDTDDSSRLVGKMAWAAFYNRVLSADEIAEHYRVGLGADMPLTMTSGMMGNDRRFLTGFGP